MLCASLTFGWSNASKLLELQFKVGDKGPETWTEQRERGTVTSRNLKVRVQITYRAYRIMFCQHGKVNSPKKVSPYNSRNEISGRYLSMWGMRFTVFPGQSGTSRMRRWPIPMFTWLQALLFDVPSIMWEISLTPVYSKTLTPPRLWKLRKLGVQSLAVGDCVRVLLCRQWVRLRIPRATVNTECSQNRSIPTNKLRVIYTSKVVCWNAALSNQETTISTASGRRSKSPRCDRRIRSSSLLSVLKRSPYSHFVIVFVYETGGINQKRPSIKAFGSSVVW
jgi:hypothetical protein